jgi:carbonic anhydrase
MTISGTSQAPPHNILLLSCMDLRLLDETVAFMDSIGMTNRYDHVILAGASLGATYEALPHWGQTFWDHVDVARELHDVREVYILEHRQCGAYRKLLGLGFEADPLAEIQGHTEVASVLKAQIRTRHPDLGVRGFLMDLSGGVIELAI